ncbi:helix-turn-helix domain-containing protein [Solihabitans fulvus]|uniref:Helix-turn-helix domain-containing protein n=1 Tax=Solihabitans fulvus TaxID=1892852 RepID=A0A5B2XE12_9PSEU|nr:helix-turn-helix domain-containing protein [Solihabitans fulvus]KAA2261466.1 helix-turn-helix domain-containing protein [Solihabitans fulvus]
MPAQQSPPPEPQAAFAAKLRDLHARCGSPTQVTLGEKMNAVHSTISEKLTGRRFPTLEWVERFVRACAPDANLDPWRAEWYATRRALDAIRH